jgi:hypothetical protein
VSDGTKLRFSGLSRDIAFHGLLPPQSSSDKFHLVCPVPDGYTTSLPLPVHGINRSGGLSSRVPTGQGHTPGNVVSERKQVDGVPEICQDD